VAPSLLIDRGNQVSESLYSWCNDKAFNAVVK